MNWLEIGCPYCPTVLTVPRTTAGLTIRCPECGKSYLVPEPKTTSSAYEVTTPLPTLPASLEEVEFEEFAAAAVARPAAAATPRSPAQPAPQPSAPQHPAPSAVPDAAPLAVPASAAPAMLTAASAAVVTAVPYASPPNAPPPSAPSPQVAPRTPRRTPGDDLMYPELEKDSPLPEVEILPPPTLGGSPTRHPAAKSAPPIPQAPGNLSPPRPEDDDLGMKPTSPAPVAHSRPLSPAEEAAAMEEVQQRIRRHRIRALINLAAFVIGIVVMTAFAFLVVRFSRPS